MKLLRLLCQPESSSLILLFFIASTIRLFEFFSGGTFPKTSIYSMAPTDHTSALAISDLFSILTSPLIFSGCVRRSAFGLSSGCVFLRRLEELQKFVRWSIFEWTSSLPPGVWGSRLLMTSKSEGYKLRWKIPLECISTIDCARSFDSTWTSPRFKGLPLTSTYSKMFGGLVGSIVWHLDRSLVLIYLWRSLRY